MMAGRFRRRAGAAGPAVDEGPFVSFTDLFIGILFLFLILVAALMLMHQEAVKLAKDEAQQMSQQMQQLQAKLEEAEAKLKIDHPAFRLGIVFNIFQRPAQANAPWTFSRTVQVFRAPSGHCINNVLLRSNLSTAWRPPTKEEDIPTARDQEQIQRIEPCGLTAQGDSWKTPNETGSLRRVSPDLYSGGAILHKQGGDVRLEMQYRVLGVYDDYFR